MDSRDMQFGLGNTTFNPTSKMNSPSCSYYNNRTSDSYPDFEGVQDLSYSAQCLQEQGPSHEDLHDDCMDLSLLLSSSKACERQQIEDELPLNLTGKAREEEINRRLRQQQQQQFNYSYPFSDPPRASQVFVAPDFLGMHELQDLRTHIYMDDTTSLNLTYCPQTLDLSAQSLDLSLSGQDLSYDNSNVDLSASHVSLNLDACTSCDILNLTCHTTESETSNMLDLALQGLHQQTLPPASSLPLPFSITQSLTSTSCQYAALDLQKTSSIQQIEENRGEEKKYACAQCGELFATPQDLSVHKETHSLSKPYPCDLCGLRFMKVGTLNRHVKTAHNYSRPFQCDLCHKTFAQKHDLHRHQKIHQRK